MKYIIQCKYYPRTGNVGPVGEQGYTSTLSLTPALDGSGCLAPLSGLFTPRGRDQVPISYACNPLDDIYGESKNLRKGFFSLNPSDSLHGPFEEI